MNITLQWLSDSVSAIAAVCAVIAVLECIAQNTASESGFRLVCGAIAASSVLKFTIGFLKEFS